MHQTLSGHFSLWLSRETARCHEAPSAARRPRTLTSELSHILRGCCCSVSCGLTSRVQRFYSHCHPSWDLFHDVFGWAHYFNEAELTAMPGRHTGARNSMKLPKEKKKTREVLQHLPWGCATLRSTLQIHQSDVQLSQQSFHIWLTHGTSQDTAADWFRSQGPRAIYSNDKAELHRITSHGRKHLWLGWQGRLRTIFRFRKSFDQLAAAMSSL